MTHGDIIRQMTNDKIAELIHLLVKQEIVSFKIDGDFGLKTLNEWKQFLNSEINGFNGD